MARVWGGTLVLACGQIWPNNQVCAVGGDQVDLQLHVEGQHHENLLLGALGPGPKEGKSGHLQHAGHCVSL